MRMRELLRVIHVLGWVFWLGADFGVFLAAQKSERRTDLSVESRLAVLESALRRHQRPVYAATLIAGVSGITKFAL